VSNSNQSNSSNTTSKTSVDEEITLTFWHSMGGNGDIGINQMVEAFNNENQGKIKVDVQYQGSYDESINKLKSAQIGGAGANIVQIYDIGTRFMIDSGWVVPMEELINQDGWDKNQIEPNLAAYYTVENQLYSMPFNSSSPLLYYNKDAFREVGLDPETPPKTFEEIREYSEKLKKVSASGEVERYAFGMYTYGWFFEQLLCKQLTPFVNNGNGREAIATEVVFDTNGGGSTILNEWNALVKDGVMPNWGKSGEDYLAAFVSEKLVMTLASTASLTNFLGSVGDKFEIGTGYFPGFDANGAGGISTGGGSLWILDSEDEKVNQASWEFVKFMVSAKQQAYWNTQTGYFPITLGAYEEPVYKENVQKNPQFATAVEQLRNSSIDSRGALLSVFPESRQIVESNIEKMLLDEFTPDQALNQMAKEINSAIENYNLVNAK
jgi:sn-glycerol 3-phosphate transport system substrate-binding protein